MASTYSTSLKIQLIGNGEQSAIWGSTTNTNWNLMEQAVSGVRTITMLNADYTLSNLNGVSDEARNMVLVAGGTNSAIRKIVAPLVPKLYIVSNQTVGGYAVTIGGATGSFVTVPFGTTAQVYCDGTNFYSAQTSSAGNFNVSGDLTVVGNAYGEKGFDGTTVTAQGYGLRVRQSSGGNAAIMQFTNYAANTQLGVITHDGSNLYITPSVGTVNAPTVSSSNNSNAIATTAFVKTNIAALGTMATQNANAVAITGGTATGLSNLATNTFTTTGTTNLFYTGSGVRSVNIGTNEIAIAQASGPVYLNLCDASGNNGNSYSLLIRGLQSAGASGVQLTGFSVEALSAGFSGALTYQNGLSVAPQPTNTNVGTWIPFGADRWNGSGWVIPGGGTWAWFISNRGGGAAGVNAGGSVVAGQLGSPSNNFGFLWNIA
jgi:hypothetical protein